MALTPLISMLGILIPYNIVFYPCLIGENGTKYQPEIHFPFW
ncbi:hypothetical protein [Xenorhabdus griffiniae]|uniref:Uncharacterized protein n=1 Tax=Xenorhabdus griffiniae TaxID=351672 RepID=A0ABY9XHI9_9GAMM|nr:hypothetical protein [Xenorhabdus griffiniae]WMV72398.1 hypothetical protein QL128_20410 [Xenorhabdus griffiniae]WNH02076.1 hypothetical protein QL112_020420 [Xenorhabdus griffiniae]